MSEQIAPGIYIGVSPADLKSGNYKPTAGGRTYGAQAYRMVTSNSSKPTTDSGGGGGGGGGEGGGGGGISLPSVDFSGAAQAQGQANYEAALKTAKLSNPNIYTPFGQQEVTWNHGQANIRQTLSPQEQALWDQLYPQLTNALSNPIDMSQLPDIMNLDPQAYSQALLDRMAPTMDKQRQMEENALLLGGHARGGTAWNSTQNDLAKQQNDARLAAIIAGPQAQATEYQTQAANRARALQEQLTARQEPLQEYSMLHGNAPSYQSYTGSTVAPPPLFDAAAAQAGYNVSGANLAQNQQQMEMQNALAQQQLAFQQQQWQTQQQIAQQNLQNYQNQQGQSNWQNWVNTGISAGNLAHQAGWF